MVKWERLGLGLCYARWCECSSSSSSSSRRCSSSSRSSSSSSSSSSSRSSSSSSSSSNNNNSRSSSSIRSSSCKIQTCSARAKTFVATTGPTTLPSCCSAFEIELYLTYQQRIRSMHRAREASSTGKQFQTRTQQFQTAHRVQHSLSRCKPHVRMLVRGMLSRVPPMCGLCVDLLTSVGLYSFTV